MKIYDEIKVSLSLDNLSTLHNAANCWQIAEEKRETMEKRYAKLFKECEIQANEINQLRCERSTRQKRNEFLPVTITAIKNAKEVLKAHYGTITSEENATNETVPGDRFYAVYKTLRVLVDRLEQEGLA